MRKHQNLENIVGKIRKKLENGRKSGKIPFESKIKTNPRLLDGINQETGKPCHFYNLRKRSKKVSKN